MVEGMHGLMVSVLDNVVKNQRKIMSALASSHAPPAPPPTKSTPNKEEGPCCREVGNGAVVEIGRSKKVVISKQIYMRKWALAKTPDKLILSLLDVCINRLVLANSLYWGIPGRTSLHAMEPMQALLQQADKVFPGCLTDDFQRSIAKKSMTNAVRSGTKTYNLRKLQVIVIQIIFSSD